MMKTTSLILLISLIILIDICHSNNQMESFIEEKRSLMCFKQIYRIPIMSKRSFRITLNRTLLIERKILSIEILAKIAHRKILQFDNDTDMIITKIDLQNKYLQNRDNESIIVVNLNLKSNYLDRTFIDYSVKMINSNSKIYFINCSVSVLTIPPQRLSNRIYLTSIPYIVVFISVQMGILLDVKILKEIVRRPVGLGIGFLCQYGLMPLIAYIISKIFFYPLLYGFGLFVVGCCPGGFASNQLTVIFNGDINLSVLMSYFSTIASFIMMPIWLYTLGTYGYLRHLKMYIPFFELMKSLLINLLPLLIGMIIAYFIPRLQSFVKRIVKPVLIILLLYFFGFATYVNFYLFSYIDWRMILTAPLLPWFGYVIGGTVAWILGQDWIRVKTIGIETGIQNFNIAFMILLYSLPEPENNQSIVIVLIIMYFSSLPFYVILLINLIRKKCFKTKIVQVEKATEIDANLSNEQPANHLNKLSLTSI